MKLKLPNVKNLPRMILKIGLPLIVLTLIYIVSYTYLQSVEPIKAFVALKQTPVMLEHVFMSLVLILGGALLANTIQER